MTRGRLSSHDRRVALTFDDGPERLHARPFSSSSYSLVRSPRGSVSPASLARVALAGYTTVLWSADSDDCRTRDVREIASRLEPRRIAPGEIIVMHEGQPWTLDALPVVVRSLRSEGDELVRVSDLLLA